LRRPGPLKACEAPFVLVAPKRNTPAGARRNPDRSALSASPIPPDPESHAGTAFAQRMHERRVPPVSHPGGLFYHAIDAMRQMPGVWGGGPKKEDEKAWGQASIHAFAHSQSEGREPRACHTRDPPCDGRLSPAVMPLAQSGKCRGRGRSPREWSFHRASSAPS